MGVDCTVYCPDTAPRTKIANVKRYGGNVIELPVDEWVDIDQLTRFPNAVTAAVARFLEGSA